MRSALTRAAGGVLAAAALYALVLRRRQLRWGATAEEADAELPGDELLALTDLTATRAITIHAGITDVWPWLAQMGQGRGGLYSYDWLENLVGCQMDSADEVVDEWQDVEVGDEFGLHPDVALTVVGVDPPHWLVVQGGISATGRVGIDDPAAPYDFTWAFVLVRQTPDTTRLLVRERYRYHTAAARPLVEGVSVISFAMTERMLRGIRDRAEGRG
jgi:hypothetical protein